MWGVDDDGNSYDDELKKFGKKRAWMAVKGDILAVVRSGEYAGGVDVTEWESVILANLRTRKVSEYDSTIGDRPNTIGVLRLLLDPEARYANRIAQPPIYLGGSRFLTIETNAPDDNFVVF